MAEKRPSFQWYPKDYLSDPNVARMTLAEEGAYRRLMDYEWLQRGIPRDTEELAGLCKIPHRRFLRLWPAIQGCFRVQRGGRKLVHPRLAAERRKQDLHKAARRSAGKRGAEVRWNDSPEAARELDKNGNPIVLPMAKDSTHARASSSSSSTTKEKAPSAPKRKRAIALPGEWRPNEKHLEIALAEGCDLNRSAEMFRDHALAKGRTLLDWDRAFNNWLRNPYDDGSRTKPRGRGRKQSPAEVALDIQAAIKSQQQGHTR